MINRCTKHLPVEMSNQSTGKSFTENEPPTLVLLGSSGVGKSTLGNVFAGCSPNSNYFSVNHNFIVQPLLSETTDIKTVGFRGDSSKKLRVIDTAGFDSAGREKTLGVVGDIVHDIASKCEFVNIFAFVINAQDPFFKLPVLSSIRMIENLYGNDFWEHVVFIFTRLSMDHRSQLRRAQNRGINDELWAVNYLQSFAEAFPGANEINYFFMEAFFDKHADIEVCIFDSEMQKFWYLLESTSRMSTQLCHIGNCLYSDLDHTASTCESSESITEHLQEYVQVQRNHVQQLASLVQHRQQLRRQFEPREKKLKRKMERKLQYVRNLQNIHTASAQIKLSGIKQNIENILAHLHEKLEDARTNMRLSWGTESAFEDEIKDILQEIADIKESAELRKHDIIIESQETLDALTEEEKNCQSDYLDDLGKLREEMEKQLNEHESKMLMSCLNNLATREQKQEKQHLKRAFNSGHDDTAQETVKPNMTDEDVEGALLRCRVVSSTQETFVNPTENERHFFTAILKESQTTILTFAYKQTMTVMRKIIINFPAHCVLGERQIFLEIYFPREVSTLRGKETILTPVVFISQPAHIPFLRKVTVKLPFDWRVLNSSANVSAKKLGFKKEIFIRDDHFEIQSFSFSPVGVVGSETDTIGEKWEAVRVLNLGDQQYLFDSSTVYFTMEQVPKPKLDDTYTLSYDCKSFSKWQDLDRHRWQDNLSLYSLSQHSAFKQMNLEERVIVQIKASNAPIVFEPPVPEEIVFSLPAGRLANGCLAPDPASFRNNVVKHDYRFSQPTEQHVPYAAQLKFVFANNQNFEFPILTKEQLENIGSMPPISFQAVAEFLGLLEESWITFMLSDIPVPKYHLLDFAVLDLLDSVEQLLPRRTRRQQSSAEVLSRLAQFEENLLSVWEDLSSNIDDDNGDQIQQMKVGELKDYVLELCRQKFNDLYEQNESNAKSRILTALTQDEHDTSHKDKLTEDNRKILAKNLLCMDNGKLMNKMKSAVRKYRLNIADMSRELRVYVGYPEELETGDNLEDTVEVHSDRQHPGEV